jgi:hypothetical protein
MGTFLFDMKIVHYLQTTGGKKEISLLERVSGIQSHQKQAEWKPIISGALEITLIFE